MAPAPELVSTTLNFPTYDNVGSAGIGDCTFAAAADWEIIQLGRTPPEVEVIADFNAAQGRGEELWDYWPRHGIDGIYAQVTTQWPATDEHLRELVTAYHAVFAQITFGMEFHAVIMDGFNAEGPVIVTWGMTWQWTWATWDAEVKWIATASLTRQVFAS